MVPTLTCSFVLSGLLAIFGCWLLILNEITSLIRHPQLEGLISSGALERIEPPTSSPKDVLYRLTTRASKVVCVEKQDDVQASTRPEISRKIFTFD